LPKRILLHRESKHALLQLLAVVVKPVPVLAELTCGSEVPRFRTGDGSFALRNLPLAQVEAVPGLLELVPRCSEVTNGTDGRCFVTVPPAGVWHTPWAWARKTTAAQTCPVKNHMALVGIGCPY